jgi:hypothetical protein
MSADSQLVVADGTGQSLVPARQLILTRAPEIARLPALTDEVAAFDVITLANHDAATSTLKTVRATRKAVETFHAAQKAPINDVRTVALDLEKRDVTPFKALETALGAKVLAFEAEVERQRRVEAERLTRERLAQAQAEADARAKALRDAAKIEEDKAVKRQLQAQARAMKDAPVFVAPVEVDAPIAKTATTTRYSAEITDVEALIVAVAVGILKRRAQTSTFTSLNLLAERDAPVAALEPERLIESHPWLNTQATQDRAEFSLPGVVVVAKTSLSGR